MNFGDSLCNMYKRALFVCNIEAQNTVYVKYMTDFVIREGIKKAPKGVVKN